MKQTREHHSIDLCDSCSFSNKASGNGKEIKLCGIFGAKPCFPVEKCSSFAVKGQQDIYELKQMAIYIEKKKEGIGFDFTKIAKTDVW